MTLPQRRHTKGTIGIKGTDHISLIPTRSPFPTPALCSLSHSRAWLTLFTLLLSAPISHPLSAESSWDESPRDESAWTTENPENLTYEDIYRKYEEAYGGQAAEETPESPYLREYEKGSTDTETETSTETLADLSGTTLDDEQRLVGNIEILFADREETTSSLRQKILARMKTIEGRYFSQLDFDQDLKTLVRDYDHVEPVLRRENNRIHLTLRIWPKPVIRCISWVGNQRFATKRLQEQLDIAESSRFERKAFHKAFQAIKAFYIKKGFFEAQLDYSVTFHEESNEVSITIEVNEGRSGKIERVLFSGFTAQERTDLLPTMITKRYRAFVSWFTGDGIYDQDAVKMDEFHILEFLHNKGYADAKVDVEVRESSFENRIDVTINADKGTQYRIGSIEFEGEEDGILSQEERERCITIQSGSIYSPDVLRETITRLQNTYGRHGYIDALVDLDTKLNSSTCTYDLRFTISPGQRYRIGLVRVVGNLCTQTRVILHENLLIPGELFNLDMLHVTEMRLFNIGYFKNVNIYPVESEEISDDGCPIRDVIIEVEETGTGNFQAFGGYSTTESLFCGITITESNFNHNGFSCAHKKGPCAFRGGGEFLSLTTNIGLKSNGVELSWTQPHFYDTPWSVGFDLNRSTNHYIAADYKIESSGASLHASYPLTPFLRFATHYRLQDSAVVLTGDMRKFRKQIHEQKRFLKEQRKDRIKKALSNKAIDLALFKVEQEDGLISAIGCGLVYDSTDSPICPTHGARTRFDVEYAGLGGQFHFLSVDWCNTYYQPITERGTLKLRADLNFVKAIGGTLFYDIPLDERLFLGGDTGLRGYRPYAVGPQYRGNPVGGLSMQYLSAEYNYRFPVFDGFLFFDAGALSPQQWFFGRLQTSAGFGVRFQLLQQAPPVTMGIGFPINPKCRREIKRFFWQMGGRF